MFVTCCGCVGGVMVFIGVGGFGVAAACGINDCIGGVAGIGLL